MTSIVKDRILSWR